jgi:hypothetical protein
MNGFLDASILGFALLGAVYIASELRRVREAREADLAAARVPNEPPDVPPLSAEEHADFLAWYLDQR